MGEYVSPEGDLQIDNNEKWEGYSTLANEKEDRQFILDFSRKLGGPAYCRQDSVMFVELSCIAVILGHVLK